MASLWRSNVRNTNNSANTETSLLQELLKLDLRVKNCIQDIQNDCDSREQFNAINLEAAEGMRKFKKTLETLKAFAIEQDKTEDKERLLRKVDDCVVGMKRNIDALRKANLAVEKSIDDQYRERLLSGGQVKQRGRADKETLLRSTSGMTENLFSISRLMADQVKHSENSIRLACEHINCDYGKPRRVPANEQRDSSVKETAYERRLF
uniref:Putative vesicle transport protein sec20 n=1 Tax=Amblyomma cajennense TaxID=34607 RepID=A0A023FEP8_AMBCJ